MFSFTLLSLYPGERAKVFIVQKAGCAPEPVWSRWRRENLLGLELGSFDRSARGQILAPVVNSTKVLVLMRLPVEI
jgi:hypothetical protein